MGWFNKNKKRRSAFERVKINHSCFRIAHPIFFWLSGLVYGIFGVNKGQMAESWQYWLFGYCLMIVVALIALWTYHMSDLHEDMLYRMNKWRKE